MRLRDVICLAIGHRWQYISDPRRYSWLCIRCGAVCTSIAAKEGER